jgi:hypothetical protein
VRKDGYIFQKDTSDDWEPYPQYKAALGNCPELVRVENGKCWTAMSDVLHMCCCRESCTQPTCKGTSDIYVNGRDWHYLCGVIATENLDSKDRQGGSSSAKGGFELKYLDIKLCAMYPEEKLGGFIHFASAQWQVIDALFQGMRDVMRCGTAYTSGTFSIIAWTNSCQNFWEVVFHTVFSCNPFCS